MACQSRPRIPRQRRLPGVAGAGRGRRARVRHRPREPLGVGPPHRRREHLLRTRAVHDVHRVRVDDGRQPQRRQRRPDPPQRDLPRRHRTAALLLAGFTAARGPLVVPGRAPRPRHRGHDHSPQRQHEQRHHVRLDRQRRPAHRRGVRAPPAAQRAGQRDRADEGPVRGASRRWRPTTSSPASSCSTRRSTAGAATPRAAPSATPTAGAWLSRSARASTPTRWA